MLTADDYYNASDAERTRMLEEARDACANCATFTDMFGALTLCQTCAGPLTPVAIPEDQ